jgi:hypothetical protein
MQTFRCAAGDRKLPSESSDRSAKEVKSVDCTVFLGSAAMVCAEAAEDVRKWCAKIVLLAKQCLSPLRCWRTSLSKRYASGRMAYRLRRLWVCVMITWGFTVAVSWLPVFRVTGTTLLLGFECRKGLERHREQTFCSNWSLNFLSDGDDETFFFTPATGLVYEL